MSLYMRIYPFELKEEYNIIFVEDMHGFKVLADNKSLSIIKFEKRCADFLCEHLNSLKINGLSVKVIGTPCRICLIEPPSPSTSAGTIVHNMPEYRVTADLFSELTDRGLDKLLDYIMSGVHDLRLGQGEDEDPTFHISIYHDGGYDCCIDYQDAKEKKLVGEKFGHIHFEGGNFELIFSKYVLMFRREYNGKLS